MSLWLRWAKKLSVTDRHTDGRTMWKQYIPPQTKFAGGITTIFSRFLSKAAQASKVMTISMGEMFGNFVWFKGKILKSLKNREMPLKSDLASFGKLSRESGSVSQNRETHYLWGRVDRYVCSYSLRATIWSSACHRGGKSTWLNRDWNSGPLTYRTAACDTQVANGFLFSTWGSNLCTAMRDQALQ